MTIDFTGAPMGRAGSCSFSEERPLSINSQASAASFGNDLQAAQLVSPPGGLGTSLPEVPLDEPGTSDISEDPSSAEQMLWLGVTLPLPIELRPEETAASSEVDSPSLVSNDSKLISHAELTSLIEVGLAPVGDPREELSVDPRSVSFDLPTLDPGLRFTPETDSPEINSPFSTMDTGLSADSSLDDIRLPVGDQSLAQSTVDEEPQSFDAPAADAENTLTVDRPTGLVSFPSNDIHTHIPHTATESTFSLSGSPVELRTELSEVVRQVRTMVTEHETRSTIQMEPADLGRLTLELVDTPEGLRAHVSAEDPAVLRFLERNVQLLEAEARLQGVGQVSFSVGADVSGGLGRGDSRQSQAEASFRKNIVWNTTQHTKPRSRRELDTNA